MLVWVREPIPAPAGKIPISIAPGFSSRCAQHQLQMCLLKLLEEGVTAVVARPLGLRAG